MHEDDCDLARDWAEMQDQPATFERVDVKRRLAAVEVADLASCDEGYVREWLSAMGVLE